MKSLSEGKVENEKRLIDLHDQVRPVMERYFKATRDPQETDEERCKRQADTAAIFNAALTLAVEERMGVPLPVNWICQIKPEDNERWMEILRDCLGALA
jgi:hypothetical protein